MTTSPESDVDTFMMSRALDEARRGAPSPNPPVGAVVVDAGGSVVGEGFHVRAGEAHAEAIALEQGAPAVAAFMEFTLPGAPLPLPACRAR